MSLDIKRGVRCIVMAFSRLHAVRMRKSPGPLQDWMSSGIHLLGMYSPF
jgi:hypothetical protein